MRKHDTVPAGVETEAKLELADTSDLPENQTDWDRVVAMTGDEAYRNALADPDSQPMTSAQLAQMRRSPNPSVIRQRLGMTQEEFARRFQIAIATLRDWEHGTHLPDSAAIAFLRVIERDPDAVLRALERDQVKRPDFSASR